MTDEEMKAMEMLDKFTTEHKLFNIKQSDGLEDNIITVLNLIEKQSKEVEEYKKQLDLDYVDNNFISKDKIKAKIEEIDNMELCTMRIPKLSTLDERLGAKIGIKYVLQSILEKE